MSKEHRLIPRKKVLSQDLAGVPLNFLLGATDQSLDDYELARLAAIADKRKQIQELFDALNQDTMLASLARWFRGQDRNALKHAIENEETAEEWAARLIRDRQRSPEELLPLPSLPPGAAHLAAAKRYQQRNIEEGKCRYCPKPLAHNSVEVCEEYLAKTRARDQQKKALSVPGSREFLYAGETPSTHGRRAVPRGSDSYRQRV